ncbi:hypothetical protein IGI04_022710 [Brassica rapa subsp. trilocularis]|uniref:Uncharacterized protein n=1 Tax=Brassica rapa subsp. trilocularis TaxID=1813537 RepID=A0ABQ7M1Q7_BRACM|nr:hypothetical protein IGI04_022710 [Brassica rapa subsp. trilocularis]
MNSNGKAIVSDNSIVKKPSGSFDQLNFLRKKLCLRFAFRKTYISGDKLPVDDVKVYVAVVEKPSDAFPSASKWYDCLAYHLLKVTNFGIVASSPVDSILDKDDYTLEELLDEEAIIQECKALNSRLIHILRDKARVEQLLRYVGDMHLQLMTMMTWILLVMRLRKKRKLQRRRRVLRRTPKSPKVLILYGLEKKKHRETEGYQYQSFLRKMKSAADLTRRLMKAETDVQPEALKGRRNL